ncbi:MAG TPA: glycosyl hydrolase [Flavobacteriales bacterium]|nr:glycosyl hydrolase [Flavobacteriales bacterium]
MKKNLLATAVLFTTTVHAQVDSAWYNYLNGIKAQSIGPTIMSGRVTDLEVDPADATHFYAAFATGGLWETKNNGTTFEQIFNAGVTFGLGDIAIDWKQKKIYAGTGENNSSRSSYAGKGVFVTDNNGKTWKALGLEETHHIGRIVLNPANPDEIFVAAIGHLFTYNKERGVYKTSDGGKTWKQVLFVNDKTGVIDIVIDPQNPKNLFAAAWQRERAGWNFEESGEGSGIYQSKDGGESWSKISTAQSGFPQGKGVGRIGLAMSYQDSNVIYAFLDNQDHREKNNEEKPEGLTKDDLRKMPKDEFLKLSDEKLSAFLRDNEFPEKYKADNVKEMVRTGKINPVSLVEFLEDANALLFDTPVKGAELYRSNDGGATWKKTHEGYLDNMVFTYGYYFGQVRVHPKNHDKVYLAAFYVATSDDGGKTIRNINGDNVHVDHHALWINPDKPGHLINGNDGGLNITYDDGKNWIKCIDPPVGQFYTVAVDNAENYNVYGGLQDNGVWCGNHNYTNNPGWQMEGKYPYQTILGGDGMQVQVDTRDNNTVYTGFQYGNYFRINKATGENTFITPKHELGERPMRYNWQAPIHLSVHQRDVLYFGSNKLFRSFNKGDDFKAISGDLTKGAKTGDVAYATLTAIHESPLRFGLLYTGSDDGLVYVTKDGGSNWTNVSAGLPENFWVRRVVASAFKESRVYACLSGHTLDDFRPMLFVSEDYGAHWKKLGGNLPQYPINVIREDPTNENLLYVGTDDGLYISLDRGETFYPVKNDLPVVPVHDLAIQEREADLLIGTHGRSLYKIDLEALQALLKDERKDEIKILPIATMRWSKNWGHKQKWFARHSQNGPTVRVPYFSPAKQTVTVKVWKGDNTWVSKYVSLRAGLQELTLDLVVTPETALAYNKKQKKEEDKLMQGENGNYYFNEGTYTVEFTEGTNKYKKEFEIKKKQ